MRTPVARVEKGASADLNQASMPRDKEGAATADSHLAALLSFLPPEMAHRIFDNQMSAELINAAMPDLLRELRRRPGSATVDKE